MNIALPVPISEYEAPEGWQVQPLSKLCAEVTKRIDPITMNGDLGGHYIGLEHMGQGTGQLEGIGNAADVVSQKSRFHAGDILFGKLRPNLRKVARPDFGGVCSTDIIVFRAKPTADPAFLFQVLQSEPLVAHAIATAAGTKMPRTHARSILSFEIAVPPLDEQRRIAEVLRSVDEAIAAQRATVEQHTRLIEAIFEEWSNQSAPLIALGALLDFKNGINFEKNEKGNEGTLTLDVMNMFSADLTPKYEGAYRISKTVPPDLLLQRGDILFVRSSVKQQGVGWTSLADGFGENTTFCGFIIRGRPKRDDFLSRFVVGVLRAPKYRRWLIQHSTRSALTNINQKTIASVEIPLPSFAQQEELVEQYEGLAAAAFDAGAALAMLERLRADVAQDLLSGRVLVPA